MTQQFLDFIRQHRLQNSNCAVAVSGGIDSVALCELCSQAGLKFIILHCNFGLRGEESERDEAFVRSLSKKYGVPVMVERFSTADYASEKKLSVQEAARELRYKWFFKLLQSKQYDYLLLAHHANDNVETTLMNFFRGTGLDGVTGIPLMIPHVNGFRPLLENTRQEILDYAVHHQLDWVEDSSNVSVKYTRNFFRHLIIPEIRKVYPQAEENVINNIQRFKQINALYKIGVEELKKKVCKTVKDEVHIPVALLKKYSHTSLNYEIIKEYGFGEKQVVELVKLCNSESGRFFANDVYQIIRHRNNLVIAPITAAANIIAVEKEQKEVRLQTHFLTIKHISKEKCQPISSNAVAQLDVDLVGFPLLFRRWKTGDYFYPLGLRKKKKLSRFFIDQKLSKTEKEKVWVVESDKRIIWVVGHRIDDRFKITTSTKKVLEILISNP